MKERLGLLFIIVLGAAWACDARGLAGFDFWSKQPKKPDVCELCEEYVSKALDYLSQNKTQSEIINALHDSCSQLGSFEQQCITLVDYYASLFFLEIASIQPEDFCKKVNLCEQIAKIGLLVQEDSCGFCKEAVSELLVKLKDPDTELEIIQTLLKVCNSMDKYAKQCKKLVFEYGPVILVNAEKFLETTDICTALHACKAPSAASQEASFVEEVSLVSDS